MLDNNLPKISVVIPLYNKVKYIKRALDSVLAQTYQDFEVIVVNDGSTDGSEKVVEQYNDPRIRLIHREHINSWGGHAARNLGIREARADLIAFLDADDEWLPDFLETILFLRECYPTLSIYATAYRRISPEGIDITHNFKWLKLIKKSDTMILDYFDTPDYESRVNTSSIVVKREAILQAGGFPEGIAQGGDDDTWFRLGLRYKTVWYADFKIINYMNAGNHIWASGIKYYGVRPQMRSLQNFIKENGGHVRISEKVYDRVATFLRSNLGTNLLAGDKKSVHQIIWNLMRINRIIPGDLKILAYSILPTTVYRKLWQWNQRVRGRIEEIGEMRSLYPK